MPYVAALDVDTQCDLTALTVGHRERRPAGSVVVIDRVLYWWPSPGGRVYLSEVKAVALLVCRRHRARLRFDQIQAELMMANLTRAGVQVREEFLATRPVEAAPGSVRLSHPHGSHDDVVTEVGIAIVDLTERPDLGGARSTVPQGRILGVLWAVGSARLMRPVRVGTRECRPVCSPGAVSLGHASQGGVRRGGVGEEGQVPAAERQRARAVS